MKADLTYSDGNSRAWTSPARWTAFAAIVGLGVATFAGGACSATPGGTDFNTGGAGSTQSGTQSGNPGGTLTGGPTSGGNGGSGVGTLVGSGGNSNGAQSTGVGGACASTHAEGKTTPLDLYIMLDKSGSMTFLGSQKWAQCTSALKTFLQAPASAGIGVGIQYFPTTILNIPPSCMSCTTCACVQNCGCTSGCNCSGTCTCPGGWPPSCSGTDYANPAVEIGVLPGNATALINSINSIIPEGGTPTRPALEGTLIHAREWAVANPDHKVVAVFATDGEPSFDMCQPNTIPDAQAVAQTYLNGTPSIPTYVIGVGSSLTSLHAIAQSGGTGMAYIVDGGPNTTQQFLDAMNAIRNSAGLACEYGIPQVTDGGAIDPLQVNVQYKPGGGGTPVDILHAQSAADCDPVQGGWYYDNNTAPTKILICPATCNVIKADGAGSIDILFGCPTVNLPPH